MLYSETGIGEMIARFRSGATSSAGVTDSGPDGKLHIRSGNVPGAERQWLVQDLPAALRDSWRDSREQTARITNRLCRML